MNSDYKAVATLVARGMTAEGFEDRISEVFKPLEMFDNGQRLCCALAVLTFVVSTLPEEYHVLMADYCRDYLLTHVGKRLEE